MALESHIGKQIAYEGCIFTIKSMGMKTFRCNTRCMDEEEINGTYECCDCPLPIVRGMFTAFELVLNIIVTNKADEDGWFVSGDNVMLVDDNSFAHPGIVLCKELPYIQRAHFCSNIQRRTQADTVILFPDLNEKSNIVALMIGQRKGARLDLERIRPEKDIFSDEAYEKVLGRPGKIAPVDEVSRIIERFEDEEQAEAILAKAHTLQKMIARLQDGTLAAEDRTPFQKEISERIEEFENDLEAKYTYASKTVQKAVDEFQFIINAYRRIKAPDPVNRVPLSVVKKAADNDYTNLCTRILQSQGYTDIDLLETDSDTGIKLSANRYGLRSIVFGRFNAPSIDSSEILELISEMARAKAQRGVFITTGHFSRSAEFKAMSESIELIDLDRIKVLEGLRQESKV